jgi:hypothetical protein
VSRPIYSLDASVERIRGLLDRIIEDDRFSQESVVEALTEIETHCQEGREALASRHEEREGLDDPEGGE